MQKIKQTRPGKHMKPLIFKCFLQEPKLCVVSNLKSYINRTKHLPKDCGLFISYIAPFVVLQKTPFADGAKTFYDWQELTLTYILLTHPEQLHPHLQKQREYR